MSGTASEFEARLAEVKRKRGYLLPHHGLLAAVSQHLIDAYDHAYTAIALDKKILSEHDREVVWLAVLIALGERNAPHHVAKFEADGGTAAEFEAIVRVASFASGARSYEFLARHWQSILPRFDADRAYAEGMLAAGAPLSPRLTWMAAAATHAALGDGVQLRRAIANAYAAQVPEPELAEALTVMMFPGSVPRFVNAARIWLEMIRAGEVKASRDFAAWAGLDGQGGFAEAATKAQPGR